jgi:hypothetical protein
MVKISHTFKEEFEVTNSRKPRKKPTKSETIKMGTIDTGIDKKRFENNT